LLKSKLHKQYLSHKVEGLPFSFTGHSTLHQNTLEGCKVYTFFEKDNFNQ
jgi:hypothetical protein